jgi:hypothetical protein
MFHELFERLYGYDKWTRVVATVQSTKLSAAGGFSDCVCEIGWRDQNRVEYTTEFRAYEESPLFQLCDGDEVEIRTNPARPSEYYPPGLIDSKLRRFWKQAIFGSMLAIVCIGLIAILLVH